CCFVCFVFFFVLRKLRPPISSLFPYTTLFRSLVFLFSYQETKKWMLENQKHQVAAYSLGFEGEDYHYALKIKLDEIFHKLKETRSEEHTSELQSRENLVCRLLLEKNKNNVIRR